MKRRNDDEKNILEIKKEIENLKKSINSIGLKNSYDNKLLEEKVKEITQMKIFENKNKNKKNSENEYKEIIDKVKDLYKIETKIENLIKMSIKNISKSDTYYLVNKKWMKEFKFFYDYDNIIKNNGKINKLFINQRFPDKLNNIDYLNVELDKKICNDAYVPINFEIFDKKNFDLIIKEINDKNKINLEFKYKFNIYLGDNKIFIQDNNNKFLYFIYSLNNKEYTLEYIIKFNQNDNIKNYISKCEPNEKFEDLIIKYGIKLSSQGDQNLIDDNYNSIGILKNINSKQIQDKKDPNHCLGLQNIGASSYMNTAIQCLCHVPHVKNYFKDKQSVYNDINNKNNKITKEYNKITKNI